MANRIDRVHEADRLADRIARTVADELREARLAAGLAQADVARAIGQSRASISRVETARMSVLTVEGLARHAAVVGLRLSLRLYPVGAALRDAAQARYIARLVGRVGHAWRVRLEVSMPLRGDLRAIDVVLEGACLIAIEVITRLRDLQAQIRAAQLKQRDFGATRLIIVVAGTHANRRVLDDARATIAGSFDMDTRRTLVRLAAGEDPGRDAIIVLD